MFPAWCGEVLSQRRIAVLHAIIGMILGSVYFVVAVHSSVMSEKREQSRLRIIGNIFGNTFVILLGCLGFMILVYQMEDVSNFRYHVINTMYGGDWWAYYLHDGSRIVREYAENSDSRWIRIMGITLLLMGGIKVTQLITKPFCVHYDQWLKGKYR